MKLVLILMSFISLMAFLSGGWRSFVKWLLVATAMVFISVGPVLLFGMALGRYNGCERDVSLDILSLA